MGVTNTTTVGLEKSDGGADHVDNAQQVAAHAVDQEDHEDTFFQAFTRHKWACIWSFYACWTIILVSFDTQAGGAVLGIPEFRKDFGYEYNGDYVIPASWQSAFNGAPIASAVVASLFAGEIADWIGRKWTLAIALAISYGAVGMEFAATNNELFFGGKLLNGVAIGTIATIMISYIGEIAPLRLRGFFTCFVGVAYGVGPLTAFIIVAYTGQVESRWAYRTIFCCQFGFAAVATFLLPFMPESPWWLAAKGRNEQAIKALQGLGSSPEESQRKFALIQVTLDEIRKETEGVTYAECFRTSNLRRTIISIMPMCIQSFSGIGFVAGYFTYYLQLAGYSTDMSFKIQIAQPVLSIVGNLMAAVAINYVGGRNLTFYGLIILTLFLLITGGLGLGRTQPIVEGTVAFILIFSWWYNVSIGSTAFSLLSETPTSRLRVKTIAIGYAVSQSINVMWQFVIPFMFNPDKANLGAKIAFIFGGLCLFSLIYLWFYQPEMTGRSYQELDEMFAKGVPARKFRNYRTDAQAMNEAVAAAEKKEVVV